MAALLVTANQPTNQPSIHPSIHLSRQPDWQHCVYGNSAELYGQTLIRKLKSAERNKKKQQAIAQMYMHQHLQQQHTTGEHRIAAYRIGAESTRHLEESSTTSSVDSGLAPRPPPPSPSRRCLVLLIRPWACCML